VLPMVTEEQAAGSGSGSGSGQEIAGYPSPQAGTAVASAAPGTPIGHAPPVPASGQLVAALGRSMTHYWYGAGKRVDEDVETSLRVKCHLRLGEWRRRLVESKIQEVAGPDTASGVGVGGVPFPPGRGRRSGGAPKSGGGSAAASMLDGSAGDDEDDGVAGEMRSSSTESEAIRKYTPDQATARIEQLIRPVLGHLRVSRACGATRYGPWHAWALANFYAAQQLRRAKAPGRIVARYAAAAVSGFGHSIILGRA